MKFLIHKFTKLLFSFCSEEMKLISILFSVTFVVDLFKGVQVFGDQRTFPSALLFQTIIVISDECFMQYFIYSGLVFANLFSSTSYYVGYVYCYTYTDRSVG